MLSYLLIFLAMATATTGALAGALVEYRRKSAADESAQMWRDIRLRNGVTESSPWHSSASSINRPGMVQVYPLTQPEQAPSDRPPFTSDIEAEPRQKQVSPDSAALNELVKEAPATPLELTDPPVAGERARVLRLINQGLSQNAIIKGVWGVSPGGSAKYRAARNRFQTYKKELADA